MNNFYLIALRLIQEEKTRKTKLEYRREVNGNSMKLRLSLIMNLVSYRTRTLKFNNGNKMNNLNSKHKYLEYCVNNGALETNQLKWSTKWFYLISTINEYSN